MPPTSSARRSRAPPRIALPPPQRPVYVEVPTDLLDGDAGSAAPGTPAPPPPAAADAASIARAAALIESAERPLLWVGGGAVQSGAGRAVARLAERLAAPVILTYAARGLLPPDHPCLVAVPPHVPGGWRALGRGRPGGRDGSDLDGMMTQGWAMPAPPRLVAVNVDAADATKNYEADVVVEGDAAAALDALAAPGAGAARPRATWPHASPSCGRACSTKSGQAIPRRPSSWRRSTARCRDDAIVVCDMCIPGYWLGGFRTPAAPRKLSYPLGWGTLGCAFPQGLGAALAGSGPAVSVSGDGGFLYACGDLATAAQERIPLTAVVVDDGGYGMLRYDQDRRGDPHEGVDLVTPDFVSDGGVVRSACGGGGGPRRRLRRSARPPRGSGGALAAAGAGRHPPAAQHLSALVQGWKRVGTPNRCALGRAECFRETPNRCALGRAECFRETPNRCALGRAECFRETPSPNGGRQQRLRIYRGLR